MTLREKHTCHECDAQPTLHQVHRHLHQVHLASNDCSTDMLVEAEQSQRHWPLVSHRKQQTYMLTQSRKSKKLDTQLDSDMQIRGKPLKFFSISSSCGHTCASNPNTNVAFWYPAGW